MTAADSGARATDGGADAALLTALRQGDEATFTRIVTEWSPAMLRLARCHVATVASAEEVVQEAWIGALRGLKGFEGRSALRTWVLRIVVNIAKTRGESERRTRPFSAVDPCSGPTVDPSRFRPAGELYAGGWWSFPEEWPPSPEGEALSGELRNVLRAALALLPDSQRAVMTLRDMDGYDAAETCEILGLTAGNQRVLLHRARASVRSKLEAYFAGHSPVTAGR